MGEGGPSARAVEAPMAGRLGYASIRRNRRSSELGSPMSRSGDDSSAIGGPPEAPRGGPQKSSPSPPPSPPSPPFPGPAPPAPPPDLAAITSSMRSTMTAASVADETA